MEVIKLSTMEQEVHALVTFNTPNSLGLWLFFAVYASPRLAERRLLWDNLTTGWGR